MAFALGWDTWTVEWMSGRCYTLQQVAVQARHHDGFLDQIVPAKRWFGSAADVPVHGVYEA